MSINAFVPQAPSAINQTLIPSAAYTLSDSTTWFPVDFFSSADVTLVVGTCSGTLNVYVQKLLPDNTTPMDIASFAGFATGESGAWSLAFVNGGNSMKQATDATLTTSTTVLTNFGSHWRVKFAIGGSNGTSTFGVYGNFSQ